MSTFLLPDQPMFVPGSSSTKIAALADWMKGHWALLFSQPEDFAPDIDASCGSVEQLSETLRARRIKPLAVLPAERWLPRNWIDALYEEQCLVVLPEVDEGIVLDVRERMLRAELERLLPPYVVVVDPNLQRRATIGYRANSPRRLAEILTVVELLQSAHASAPTKLELEMA